MNGLWNVVRNQFSVEAVNDNLFLKINGPPPSLFTPNSFVHSWLLEHRGPTDQNRMNKKKPTDTDKSDAAVALFC